MNSRKLTVREDEKGIFVRFQHFAAVLIVRPGLITCPTFPHNGPYKKGEKVTVKLWNIGMGYFLLYQPNTGRGSSIWQGPRYDNQTHKWVEHE